jgi:[ribosomal protein S18]-alanine N-acetyltransferase
VTPVDIVPMRREHINELLPYEVDLFGSEAWSRASYLDELADTRYRRYLVAVDDGRLVGWAGVRVLPPSAEILTVGVVPSARRRGIGTQLLTALTDEARRRGADEVFLEVRVDNEAAQTLYEREGFYRLGVRRGYYEGGRVDAVTMRAALLLPSSAAADDGAAARTDAATSLERGLR